MAIGDATGGVSTSGSIYFSGLGSGTDFSTIIEKLVSVEQTRVQTYVTWQTTWAEKNVAFQDLNTELLSLRTSLESIDTMDSFLQKSASSSDTTVLTATATGTADTGTYSYSVKQLAQNKVMVTTSGFSSLTQDINYSSTSSKFVYTYQGVTVSDTVPAGATLSDLISIINAQASNAGVRASAIYDGSSYYLQFKGLDTGAAASLVISGATTLRGFTSSNFVTTQANQDAKLKLNGWPLSNAWISRASNTVSDLIDGVTLGLKSSGAGTITVETDVSAVVDNVQSFVDQVNTVRSAIQSLTKYDSTNQQASLLTGDIGLQMISSAIDDITADMCLGFSTKRDSYFSLSSLGISTVADESASNFGLLTLDTTTLEDLLASNSSAVAKVFSANYLGDTDSADLTYDSCISGITKAGSYDVSYTVSNGKIVSATIGGNPAIFSSNSSTITGASGHDAAGLEVTVTNLTNGTYSHTINLRLGKLPELVDELGTLTDADSGPLTLMEQDCTSVESDLQTKIDNENVRIQTMATNLKEQYSQLDTILGQYSQVQSSLQSYISQLSSST